MLQSDRDLAARARDKDYWAAVRTLYAVTRDVVNLENGYWGIMAEPVRREFIRQIDKVNYENTYYVRQRSGADFEDVRSKVAEAVGAAVEEIAFTRGATEALQLLIGGYNRLKPGEAVLYADLDYDAAQYAMNALKARRGVEVVKFNVPEPATRQAVLDAYARALEANPKTRVLLLTHVSNRTGLVMPVAEIVRMAKAKSIDTIVDAAHSWGQLDFKVGELGADFVGFNLHKWIGAPLGVGFLYIRKDRLADIDRDMGDEDFPEIDIRSRVHTGTVNFATVLTVPAALALHQEIGAPKKQARLRYLRDYWVSRVRAINDIEILTPDETGLYGAITSFRLAGKTGKADNDAIVAQLRDGYKVLTVRRAGVAKGQCIRVTPGLHTEESDLDRLVEALAVVTGTRAG
ncbi:aminotransferase class V-fold PLP-dependent enzyme [Bradyrhizobium elkanii]|uniref:aminotransferase class V-fold PLP-dependent enzyme n=1 Tax=Bradyrhizobium elkanii TaxID=29448 RepID=UPI001449A82D|nr:aminotransferase class V-fold PLP-dependent enzyme [Bradyrhizobium elkanii]MCP1927787.1 selenocysteine lyase/cysteine desulfurase [Bradyrhizobium elkanii]MCS3581604.1 selenocysteine lyase/cysteine desulfurase [Bradyrhizobium elkanii]MCS3724478.1 selenocysteine lyase/cysteine desulfurase [Bradyrhizobium elkanii]MCS4008890.1 selenocysteine lyase/cysteine desulfurase [Bradyrhizobium elkanii USDA 61]BBB94761.1 cysteine desulfurase [Bradyrhizobium elkanii USDA 61]